MITIYAIIDFDIFIDIKSNLAQKYIRNPNFHSISKSFMKTGNENIQIGYLN